MFQENSFIYSTKIEIKILKGIKDVIYFSLLLEVIRFLSKNN